MRKLWATIAVLAALTLPLRLSQAQVLNINPTATAQYYWDPPTSSFRACPNSSTQEAFQSTPQAFAPYGLNASLGQWTPYTGIASCAGGGVISGPGAPTNPPFSCSAANYGQLYVDLPSGPIYICNGTTWVISTSTGLSLEHNGTPLTDQTLLNFNDTSPAPPAGNEAVTFQTDSGGDLSAYVPTPPSFTNELQFSPVPPVPGQQVFIQPTSFSTVTGGTGPGCTGTGAGPTGFALGANTAGWMGNTCTGNGLTSNRWGVNWSGFTLPAGITPAQVTAVYAVSLNSFNPNYPGTSSPSVSCTSTHGGTFNVVGSGAYPLQQFTTAMTGTIGTDIATLGCGAAVNYSTNPPADTYLNVPSIGILVYYTGAPVTQPPTIDVLPPLYYNPATGLGLDPYANLFTLTTTGSSGVATYVNNVLNIPDYASGTLPCSGTCTSGILLEFGSGGTSVTNSPFKDTSSGGNPVVSLMYSGTPETFMDWQNFYNAGSIGIAGTSVLALNGNGVQVAQNGYYCFSQTAGVPQTLRQTCISQPLPDAVEVGNSPGDRSGTLYAGFLNANGTNALTLGAMSGTQCLEEVAGVVTATGSGCASGTVTSVSVVTANGISGTVANPTTTPAITLTLGAITPTSTNGVSAATMAFMDATSSVQTQLNSKGTGTVTSFAAPAGSWPSWLVPTVAAATTTPSLSVAASSIPNGALANAATTVNGQTCTLGSTCTIPVGTGTVTDVDGSASDGAETTVGGSIAAITASGIVRGSFPELAESGNVTVTEAMRGHLLVSTGTSNWVYTLPTPSGTNFLNGFYFEVKNGSTTNTVVLTPAGSTTIDGLASVTVPAHTALSVEGDGTNYHTTIVSPVANNAANLFFGSGASGGVPSMIAVTTAALPGSGATTVNSQTCTLGSACTIPFETNSVNNASQAGLNMETSTVNAVGLTVTPTNPATNGETFEITGTYTGAFGGTLAFPVTVSGTVNSGGIPYFNSATQMSSSAVLALNAPVLGGGAGAAPVTSTTMLFGPNLLENAVSTTNTSYLGGQDASSSSALGSVTLRGGSQSGAGGAASAGGNATVKGGDNAATNAASEAGNVELAAGQSTGSPQGLQGLLLLSSAYVKGGGTSTLWNLQCLTSQMTVNDCAASPNAIVGVALAVNANTVQIHRLASQTPVNASAAVTVGDTVCAGATAGKVTDSGGTAACTTGFTVGVVLSVSGTYALPISGAVTLSTTLPLITVARLDNYPSTLGTTAALTMNNSGAGAASGTTFNGSVAETISYNTIGAASATAATTVNGQTCTLGSTCTIPFQTNSVNNTSQAGLNFETSTTNAMGLTATPVNSGTNVEKFEITNTGPLTVSATGTDVSNAGNLKYSSSIFSIDGGSSTSTPGEVLIRGTNVSTVSSSYLTLTSTGATFNVGLVTLGAAGTVTGTEVFASTAGGTDTVSPPAGNAATLTHALPATSGTLALQAGPQAFGLATLVAGTVTVSNSAACAASAICVYSFTNCGPAGTTTYPGTLALGTVSAGTSFVINSVTSAAAGVLTTDTSKVCWRIN